jgi:hypothetical protein
LYDANCSPIGPEFAWPPALSFNYVMDAAIDQSGNFVLLWQQTGSSAAYISFYDSHGARIGNDQLVDPMLCTRNYGMHVAMNAASGAGIVTCQQQVLGGVPIYYRRFNSSHAWLDPAMVEIPETIGELRSSSYETHIVGMNDSGAFAIEWELGTPVQHFEANFYNASGTFVRNVTLGPDASIGVDAFRQRHQAVQIFNGTDFVFRNAVSPVTLWRYSAAGDALLGCGTSTLRTDSWRINGATTAFLAGPTSIVRGAVDLTVHGCP